MLTSDRAGEPHVVFVNSGILGQRTFAGFVERAFVGRRDGLRASQIVIAEGLSVSERITRRVLCQRAWHDGALRNLDFFRFRAEWNAGLVARRRIGRLRRAGERIDVLHFHHQATAYGSLADMRRTPSIVSIDCTQGCVLARARTRLEAWTYGPNVRRDGQIFRAARLIVSPSEWAARCVRREYPDCTTEIRILVTPVELDGFDPGWADERYARAAAPAYRPRVLFVGGDFARKGGYDLLETWRSGEFGSRATLHLVTAARIDPALLPPGVVVHAGVEARTPEWFALWRDADVFALPTRDEALGMVFQEAGAAGLPGIGTRINAVPELVEDGESGLLVSPGDRAALGAALDRLLGSPDLRRQFGLNARRRTAVHAASGAYREALAAMIQRLASTSERVHADPAA